MTQLLVENVDNKKMYIMRAYIFRFSGLIIMSDGVIKNDVLIHFQRESPH